MKKIKKYLMLVLLLVIFGNHINIQAVQAASAELQIYTDVEEVHVGENLFVYITINSETMFGDFEAYLTYNEEVLEYISGASVITGGSGYLKISDVNTSEAGYSRKYTLKFETLKVGSSEITFDDAIVYEYESGMGMAVSIKDLEVSVKAAQTASDNAFLGSLKISPSNLSPDFDKNTFTYETMVSHTVDRLVVEAVPEDEKSIVKISGNDSFIEGENKVIVTVLAESGANIEYTINVIRETAPVEEDNTEGGIITPGTKHGSFAVARLEDELFIVYNGRYKLIEPDSEVKIPSGYKRTQIIISDIAISAYTPEDNLDSEFLLIYAMNEMEEKGFYRYDRHERTLQRYVAEGSQGFEPNTDTNIDEIIRSDEYQSNLNKAAVIIGLLSALSVLLLIISIRLFMKSRGYRDDDLD
ncbi:cadherin-like beta sandwich domain-containing protein [Mobilitalea sibirica]|uniref:Cadherin-like beta sandwich domain-containing protein n=1 Tax=Mobilitalea sibirica TaxID=1462919 RepID=A0A8J7L1V7_9FIRM|nr:cadherin-like beta sandwich domain-containing protein [Mobilitalea sibirica]MBH1939293.1 cadherin-like beta sandwich domain-containing protein [Mobilitalea sibirica]